MSKEDDDVDSMGHATESSLPEAPMVDLAHVARTSWDIFAHAPRVHILIGLLVTLGSALSFGVLMGPLVVGYARLIRAQQSGDSIAVNRVFQGFNDFPPAFVAWLLPTLGIAAGSALIILPGLVLAFFWTFTLWFVALHEMAPVTAMGASWQLTKSHVGPILTVLLAVLAVNLLGSILLLGILVTLPLGFIALTVTFEEFQG